MTAIDLCCGMGGLSKGLLDAGIEVVQGVDIWPSALKVYARNLAVPTLRADLARLPKLARVDLICGGPPCQDFSSAGKRREGARAGLTTTFAEAVAICRPKFVLYENVPAATKGDTYHVAKNRLQSVGYGLTEVVLDASLYGVPQKRKRLILVGVLGGEVDALRDSLVAGAADKPLTVRDYCLSQDMPLAVQYYYHNSRYNNSRAIWGLDEPAPTLRSNGGLPLPTGYRPHPLDATTDLKLVRALMLPEASLVQTFPASWDWCDTRLKDGWLMLANSVPPGLGHHLGRVLRLCHAPGPK